MQMGIVHGRDTDRVRLSLPKTLKKYMEETYQINESFLYLENKIFRGMDQIKQIRIYPPEKGSCKTVGRKLYQPVQSAVTRSREKICGTVQPERERII